MAPEAPAVARVHAERVIRGVHDAVGRAVVPRPGKVVPERALVPELASRSSVEHRAQQRAVAVEVGALAAVLAVTLDEEHAGFVRVGPRAGVHPPVAPRAHPFTTVPAVLPSRVRPARAEMGRVSRGRRPVPGPAGRSSRGRHGPAPRPSREPPRAEVLARGGRDRRRRRGGVELPLLQLTVVKSTHRPDGWDAASTTRTTRPPRPTPTRSRTANRSAVARMDLTRGLSSRTTLCGASVVAFREKATMNRETAKYRTSRTRNAEHVAHRECTK